ncbi:MAG: GNAT family N-acetyltransferase [Novosphingobium sp.]|nr:GNAT family N-acetyltransferase [Novosphingobium sp.]
MDRQPTLESDRLLLRPLQPGDWDALHAVASDPLVWEQHPAHDRWREDVFRAFFDDALANKGAVVVIDKASDEIIGSSRWQAFDPAHGGSVEIGWTFLARKHWGDGTNRDLKRLMVGHALEHIERVRFRVGEHNYRSRRAMEKIGGRLTEDTEIAATVSGPVLHVIYEISRDDYANGPLSG